VECAVAVGNNLPILKYVLVTAQGNQITLAATNLEMGVTTVIPGKVISDGRAVVPFQAFATIIGNSDSERISLELTEKALIVRTDNYHAKLQHLPPDEFPLIPKIEKKENTIELDGEVLIRALSGIVHAAQVSEIRPELSGILFDFDIQAIKFAATDSFRLAEQKLAKSQFSSGINRPFRAIIPLQTVQEIIRIFPSGERIILTFDPHQVLVQSKDIALISRLIDGTYPDYEQIVPKSATCELAIDRTSFMNSVKLVSTFSGKVNDIKLKLNEDGKTLEVFSASQHLGENQYLIPVKRTGDGFGELSFNWRFLLDGLKTLPGERISFGVSGDSKPAMLRSPDENSYFYLLMPIKQ
jgi:DNA polymerase-3 subunit beta